MKRIILSLVLFAGLSMAASGQSSILKDFRPVCDTLDVRIKENRDVKGELKLKNVMRRGNVLDFYFTESLGDYPWRKGEPERFRKELKKLFPEKYSRYSLGEIYSRRIKLEDFVTTELGFDGKPADFKYRTEAPHTDSPLVRKAGGPEFSKGLSGRNIAVWQSHGKYFDNNAGKWIWQRPCLFQTVEDMFTQSFVLPYLVPMLENAGAYVMIPRERDSQIHEVISDFDNVNEAYGTSSYNETGKWKDAGTGFAASQSVYTGTENPFKAGSARMTDCVKNGDKKEASASWRPDIPERGEYAVYISYKSLPESSSAVSYTVKHLGGKSEFIVNQQIGGGTWIYLGTFEFDKGDDGYVTMSNMTPKGYEFKKGLVVTADAVRFGGGMGNIARASTEASDDDEPEPPVTSGMPRFAEGARYWLQWAGADEEIFSQNELKNDYRDDFMSRGDWVEWISRGSKMNPSKEKGLGIPVDLALGFHSDAGVTPNDSIVGTLAIYTMKSEGKVKLPGGEHRMTSREYADLVQSQIVNDIASEFNPEWSRRCIWDRGYRESRTPSCPSVLLELLSHQNFADMKYGLDPTFRFTVGRAVYKGMLKYLSNRYGVPYVVQPLPVGHMGISFASNEKAVISWKETEDRIEPTAKATGFMLYTRVDGGGFDNGKQITAKKDHSGRYSAEVQIKPGHIYSFRIAAVNDGGISFPSETVSIGTPKNPSGKKVLVINNFDRVSGPAFTDTRLYAGFDNRLDSGVPYVRDMAYIGEMYEFRRNMEWVSNNNPGFGASYDGYAGKAVAGNTFDYPYVHGKAIMNAGYPFYSCSNEAFAADSTYRKEAWAADIICGKQITTTVGSGAGQKYQVFPYEMQETLKKFTAAGGHVLTSGANIATDAWDTIYPIKVDSAYRTDTQKFIREVLGYKWVRNRAGMTGEAEFIKCRMIGTHSRGGRLSFHNKINSGIYCVESPDGIVPSGKNGKTFMRYSDTQLPAGVCHEGRGYRTVSLGFPVETLENEKDINTIIRTTLEFFSK